MESSLSLALHISFIFLMHSSISKAVMDLNPRQIQYVADHLTDKKCTQLLGALHQKGFQIKSITTTTAPAQTEIRPRPCVVRLKRWCDGLGRDMTFDFLVLRLKEIGLGKVADRLSESVFQETSNELHEHFLDDPFQDMVPTDPIMVDKPDSTTQLLPPVDAQDRHDQLFKVVIILLVILSTIGLSLSVCLACPRAGHFVCLRACPSQCSVCYELVVDGCQNAWSGSKHAVDKYLLVTPEGGEGGFLV